MLRMHARVSRAAASCARPSINVACTFKNHCMRKNLQVQVYKHFHVGILVIPHFHVHHLTRFDQSSRLTPCFRLERICMIFILDFKISDLSLSLSLSLFSPVSNKFIQSNMQLCINLRKSNV